MEKAWMLTWTSTRRSSWWIVEEIQFPTTLWLVTRELIHHTVHNRVLGRQHKTNEEIRSVGGLKRGLQGREIHREQIQSSAFGLIFVWNINNETAAAKTRAVWVTSLKVNDTTLTTIACPEHRSSAGTTLFSSIHGRKLHVNSAELPPWSFHH